VPGDPPVSGWIAGADRAPLKGATCDTSGTESKTRLKGTTTGWRIVVDADSVGLTYKDALRAELEKDPRVDSAIDVPELIARPAPAGTRWATGGSSTRRT